MADDISFLKKMDQKRFEALVGHSRNPNATYMAKEIAWYSNDQETIIAVVLVDLTDDDFTAIVLGRDEARRFRAIEVEASFPTLEEAQVWLEDTVKWHTASGRTVFPQGDTSRGIDLFTPVVPDEKQHPYFKALISDIALLPARSIIQEMMPHFIDIDGNFVEQFQTTGFDARVWELYLNSYFTAEQLSIHREFNAPDFIVEKLGATAAVEAVIVGRKANNPPKLFGEVFEAGRDRITSETENAMPIRFGSPLYSKLKKKYWDLPHVNGKPIIIAIADFHDDQSMLWSSTALINYLYGVRHDYHYDEHGQLVITPVPISSHTVDNKVIPSGFFFQPETENISAVLFSAMGTISKFNRMGRQAGFGDDRVVMIRYGTCHDHDPNASVPKVFQYVVDESSGETWAEGLSLYHNPRAVHPVKKDLFPNIAHHRFVDGQLISNLPKFHPYMSFTFNMKKVP